MDPIKLQYADSKQASKGISELRTAIQNRHTKGKLLSAVKEREEVYSTWEEHSLNSSEKNAGDNKSSEVMNRRHDSRDGSP
jgi:hypothetical protein